MTKSEQKILDLVTTSNKEHNCLAGLRNHKLKFVDQLVQQGKIVLISNQTHGTGYALSELASQFVDSEIST